MVTSVIRVPGTEASKQCCWSNPALCVLHTVLIIANCVVHTVLTKVKCVTHTVLTKVTALYTVLTKVTAFRTQF